MKTVIISYKVISPAVLASLITRAFDCATIWRDLDEDYFEFEVFFCQDLAMLEDVLSEYL